jgi:arylsulfatase A-like enzyme
MARRTTPVSAVLLGFSLLCLLLTRPVAAAADSARPNVILIMTDDQGIGDFGSQGNPVIRTPHLDAMARRSASMSTFYVSPVCSPTRASLLTGRYNYRTRVVDTWIGRSMMEPAEVTLAEVLSAAGYATGIFGKWHLGDCYPMRPIDQGFDVALVHRGGGLAQPSEPRENQRRYTNPILFRNGQPVQTEGYCTDVYFDAALQFIQNAQQHGRNFFVSLPTNAPHGPLHDVPEALRKEYRERDDELLKLRTRPVQNRDEEVDALSRTAAMITNIDQNVGRLFEHLAQWQLTHNTLVIFLVDNGPDSLRYVRGLRGMKSHVHEGGVRSPLWLQWPARLQAGTTRHELSAHIDLMPTILDACGVPVPEGVKLDGRSLLPLLENRADVQWPERTIAIQSHRGDVPVRYHHFMIRDARWKLVHPSGFGRERFEGEPQFELYDLENDPGESTNLAAQHPEIVASLQQAYDRWFDDVSATRPNNYDPPRIVLDAAHESPTVLTPQDWRGRSWGPGSNGHWELHAPAPRRCDVRVEFEPRDTAGRATLTAGPVVRQVEMPAQADHVIIDHVELPGGDFRLHVELQYGAETIGPRHVLVQ